MATRAYVGCADPENPNLLHVRFVLYGGEPAEMLSVLAQLRHLTFAGDTTAALAAILAHDWTYLSAGVTARTHRDARRRRHPRRRHGHDR